MQQLKITINTDDKLAKELLNKVEYLFYIMRRNAFLSLYEIGLSKYKKEKIDKDTTNYIEESDDGEYLERELKKLNDFLDSEESKVLQESREYRHLKADRVIRKLSSKTKKRITKDYINKAIKTALIGNTPRGLFLSIGIIISAEIRNI